VTLKFFPGYYDFEFSCDIRQSALENCTLRQLFDEGFVICCMEETDGLQDAQHTVVLAEP